MTTWLEDASANRHIKTYVKDFLDVSGNFSVRQKENRESYYDQLGQTIRTHYKNASQLLGKNVCMDASGTTVAVSVNNDVQTWAPWNGLVYVYRYDASAQLWLQHGDILHTPDGTNTSTTSGSPYNYTGADNQFGRAMEMSADGNVMLIGDSHYNGDRGIAYTFTYDSSSNTWVHDGDFYGTSAGDYHGYVGAALSGDGNTVAIARYNNTRNIKVYRRNGPYRQDWVQIGYDNGSSFPSLNYDGTRLIGYHKDTNNYTIYDYSGDGTTTETVYMETQSTTWSLVGNFINHSSNEGNDYFYTCTSINSQGNIIAMSRIGEEEVWVYKYDDATSDWVQYGSALEGFLISNDPGGRESSQRSLVLNAAGDHVMFGQTSLDTNHQMRIYKYCDTTNDWVHLISLPTKTPTQQSIDRNEVPSINVYKNYFGCAMACSDDMSRFIVGAMNAFPSQNGSAYVYQRYDPPVQTYDTILDISNGVVDFPQLHREYKPNDVLPSPYKLNRFQYIRRPESEVVNFGWAAATNRDGSMFITSARLGTLDGGQFGSEGRVNTGNVYVYKLVGRSYVTIGEIPCGDTTETQRGYKVAMDDSGHRVVVAERTSFGVSPNDDRGRMTVYDLSGTTWVQVGSPISGDGSLDRFAFGAGVAISGNGRIIAGYSLMRNYVRSYEYVDASGDWVARPQLQQQHVRGTTGYRDCVRLNYDGSIIAWGDPYDDAAGTDAGRVYVFKYTGDINDGSYNLLGLSQGFRNKPHVYDGITFYDSGGNNNDQWGHNIALSDDGYIMALSSHTWSSSQGKVVVMRYSEVNDEWIYFGSPIHRELAYPQANIQFGNSISLSGDGKTLAVFGRSSEDTAGGIWVFKYLQGDWHSVAHYLETIQNSIETTKPAYAMSKDASTIIHGNYMTDQSNVTDNGHVVVLKLSDKTDNVAKGMGADEGCDGDGGNRYKWGLRFQDAKKTIITNDEVITKSMILRNRDDSLHAHFNSSGDTGGNQPVYAGSTRSFENINGAPLFTSTINATQVGCGSTLRSGIGFHWLGTDGDRYLIFRIDGTGQASFCGPSYHYGLSGMAKYAIVGNSTTEIQNYVNNQITAKLMSHYSGMVIGSITAHANAFSDERIKKNVQTIDDASSLEKLRLLNPCTYNYIDKVTRGNYTVEGFIAQEVNEILPYAVIIEYGEIPNIYKMASCEKDSNGNQIITIPDYDTANLKLDASGNMCSKLLIYNKINEPTDITITSVLSSTSLQVESTHPIPNEIFIYGQYVDDRHRVDKTRIFTVMTSALQEVDRQLQAERAKTATLETELASLLADVIALEAA